MDAAGPAAAAQQSHESTGTLSYHASSVPQLMQAEARPHDRAAQRHARRDDVQEAAERERRPEGEQAESKVHTRSIGARAAGVEAQPLKNCGGFGCA